MENAGVKVTLAEVKRQKDRQLLAELLAERGRIKREKVELEAEERALNEQLVPIFQRLGYKAVTAPDDQGIDRSFLLVNGTSTSLDKKALITKGVPPEVLAECTRVTSYTTISVREIKQGAEE